MAREALTQEYLKSILDYDPLTGIFLWKKSAGEKRSVLRYIGKIAGSRDSVGRMAVCLKGKYIRLHRLAWLYTYGELPDSHIDHINMNQSDNRICNLRLATRSQNQCNRGLQSNNTSGYKGVSRHRNKWAAYIKVKRKRTLLGLFNCPTAAHFAYCQAAKKYHGEFANVG